MRVRHLRQQFGPGYKLFLTKSSSWANDTEVQAIMAKHAVEATVDSENNAELVLMLPASSSAKFADILDDLEAAKDGLGILSYSLSLVSLEGMSLSLFFLLFLSVCPQLTLFSLSLFS